jgi:transcriptional regulator with XRE-family HTH domain
MPDKERSKQVITSLLEKDGRETAEIAKDLKVSKQRLGNYKDGKRFPNADFVQKWKNKFGQNIMDLIEPESTNVSRETKKLTSVDKASDNSEKEEESVLRRLVERNDKYRLVPTIILDQYEILSKNEIQSRENLLKETLAQAREMSATKDIIIADKKYLIKRLFDDIKKLESELKELREREKTLHTEPTKK